MHCKPYLGAAVSEGRVVNRHVVEEDALHLRVLHAVHLRRRHHRAGSEQRDNEAQNSSSRRRVRTAPRCSTPQNEIML